MSNSNIPQIDILTDTWQTVITRVNSLITSLSSEIITANSSASYTGTLISPRNASLYGKFSASSLSTISGSFSANDTLMVVGNNVKILANNSTGGLGSVLTSGGVNGNVYWSTIDAAGVTSVANGAGLVGGTITTSGTLSVKAGDGIIVDTRGVSVGQYLTINTITANGSVGSPGQTLVSGGSGSNMYWKTINATSNGVGLISNSNVLSVKAGSGIIVNANGVSVTNPTLRHATPGYVLGGQVFVQSTQPTATAQGDIWIQI